MATGSGGLGTASGLLWFRGARWWVYVLSWPKEWGGSSRQLSGGVLIGGM